MHGLVPAETSRSFFTIHIHIHICRGCFMPKNLDTTFRPPPYAPATTYQNSSSSYIHSTIRYTLFITTSMSIVALLCRRRLCIQHTQDDEDQMYTEKCVNMGDEGEEERGLNCIPAGYPHMHRERRTPSRFLLTNGKCKIIFFIYFFF